MKPNDTSSQALRAAEKRLSDVLLTSKLPGEKMTELFDAYKDLQGADADAFVVALIARVTLR